MQADFLDSNETHESLWTFSDKIDDYTWQHWWDVDWCQSLSGAPAIVTSIVQIDRAASTVDFQLPPPAGGFSLLKQTQFRGAVAQLVDTVTKTLRTSRSEMQAIEWDCNVLKRGVDLIIKNMDSNKKETLIKSLPDRLAELEGRTSACIKKSQNIDAALNELIILGVEIGESMRERSGSGDQSIKDKNIGQAMLDIQIKQEKEDKATLKEAAENAKEAYEQAEVGFREAVKKIPTGSELMAILELQALSFGIEVGANLAIAYYNPVGYGSLQLDKLLHKVQSSTAETPLKKDEATSGTPTQISDISAAYGKASDLVLSAFQLRLVATSGAAGTVDWKKVGATDATGVSWARMRLVLALKTLRQGDSNFDDVSKAKETFKKGIELCQTLEDLLPTKPTDKIEELVPKIKDFARHAAKFYAKAVIHSRSSVKTSCLKPKDDFTVTAALALEMSKLEVQVAAAQVDSNWKLWHEMSLKMTNTTKGLDEHLVQLGEFKFDKELESEIVKALGIALKYIASLKDGVRKLIYFFQSVNVKLQKSLGPKFIELVELIRVSTEDAGTGPIKISPVVREDICTHVLITSQLCNLLHEVSKLYVEAYDSYIEKGVNGLTGLSEMSGVDLDSARTDLIAWATPARTSMGHLILQEQKRLKLSAQKRIEKIKDHLAADGSAKDEALLASLESVGNEFRAQMAKQREGLLALVLS